MQSKVFLTILITLVQLILGQKLHIGNNYLPQHSLYSPPSIPFWKLLGEAHSTENYIRLTNDRQSQKGAIWNVEVMTLKKKNY